MYEAPDKQTRSGSDKQGNLLGLSGNSLLEAFSKSLQLGGQQGLVLRLLLSALQRKLSLQLGSGSGAEFKAARVAAEAVDAQLVLGDRPIEITLSRAWASLSWRKRLQLMLMLARAVWGRNADMAALDAASIERLKEDDAISMMYTAFSQQFPELVGPCIHERDMYLAWSLKRSKAVNGCKTVVGVVGKGHLRGITWIMLNTAASDGLRFRDLVGRRQKPSRNLQKFVLETAVVTGLYMAWTTYVQ
jgi:pheromone shutdown protein TraB